MNIIYTWAEFEEDCKKIATFLDGPYEKKIKNIYGIPKGGLIPAVMISHLLGEKHVILNDDDIEKNTLIIDDISDSGKQLIDLHTFIQPSLTVTLWICDQTKFVPNCYIRVKEKNDWIIFPWETK